MGEAATEDDARVAAVFRAALSLGIATPADLVPWADGQVLARPAAPEWIIDVSLSAAEPMLRVDGLLSTASAGTDPATVFRLIVGLMETTVPWTRESASRASHWLYATARRFGVHDMAISTAGVLDDELLSSWVKESDIAPMIAEVRRCFAAHADPAARAWLPGVLVNFAGAERRGRHENPI